MLGTDWDLSNSRQASRISWRRWRSRSREEISWAKSPPFCSRTHMSWVFKKLALSSSWPGMASNTAMGRLQASASETVRPPGFVTSRSAACMYFSTSSVKYTSLVGMRLPFSTSFSKASKSFSFRPVMTMICMGTSVDSRSR